MNRLGCDVCRREPEPGYIETENNGPVVPCWSCNFEEWKRASSKRLAKAGRG